MTSSLILPGATTERSPVDTDRNTLGARRLSRLPLLYRVLVVNSLIVVLGAVVGTGVTILAVHPDSAAFGPWLAAGFAVAGIALTLIANWYLLRSVFRPLGELEDVALAVRSGDLAARVVVDVREPDTARLAIALNETLDQLGEERAKLQQVTAQVLSAQEKERKRLSWDLHDDVAQLLFAQLLRSTALKAQITEGVPYSDLLVSVTTLEDGSADALERVRRLAMDLRPPALDDLGLMAALEGLAQRYSTHLKIPVGVLEEGERWRIPTNVELVLYRVAQESLTNAAKYAQASMIEVVVRREHGTVVLEVRDDGVGFASPVDLVAPTSEHGMGLFGMSERATVVGGTFSVQSTPGSGTVTRVVVPIAAAVAA